MATDNENASGVKGNGTDVKKRRNRFLELLQSRDATETVRRAQDEQKSVDVDPEEVEKAIEARPDAPVIRLYNMYLREQQRPEVNAWSELPWEDADARFKQALIEKAKEVLYHDENPDWEREEREKLASERSRLENEKLEYEKTILLKNERRKRELEFNAKEAERQQKTQEEIEYDALVEDLLRQVEPGGKKDADAQRSEDEADEAEKLAIEKINAAIQNAEQQFESIDKRPPDKVDANVYIWVSDDHMEAWGVTLPPLHGGALADERKVVLSVSAARLSFGLIRDAITGLADSDTILCPYRMAKGRPIINGNKGEIEDLTFINTKRQEVKGGEEYDGKIDFKELDLVVNVQVNQELCKIIPPTPHVNGKTVFGEELPAKVGAPAFIPVGLNTMVNADGTAVVAKIAGQVVFNNGRYCVDNLLMINGDVNLTTGNLHANGSIMITGNVQDGFSVEAKGDVTVRGSVAGASVVAGGNVVVIMGMNAGNRGIIEAGRDVRCRYLENGIVKAGGNVYLESCVNSNIYSDQNIYVTSGRGAIIGGTVVAMESIVASTVGNRINRPTLVALGTTPQFEERMFRLNNDIKSLKQKCERDEMVISKLRNTDLPPDKVAAFEKVISNYRMNKIKIQRIETTLQDMLEYENKLKTRIMRFGVTYPNVTVSIDGATRLVSAEWTRCKFRRNGDEVEMMGDIGGIHGR